MTSIILEKSVGSRFLAQPIDSTALQKNTRLTEWVKLRFFQSTVKPIACTINPRPTDLSRIIELLRGCKAWHVGHWEVSATRDDCMDAGGRAMQEQLPRSWFVFQRRDLVGQVIIKQAVVYDDAIGILSIPI